MVECSSRGQAQRVMFRLWNRADTGALGIPPSHYCRSWRGSAQVGESRERVIVAAALPATHLSAGTRAYLTTVDGEEQETLPWF